MVKKAQKETAEMEKEIPVDVKKIETPAAPEESIEEDRETPWTEEVSADEIDEKGVLTEQEERQLQVKEDVEKMKNAIEQLLLSTFDIKLDDDDLILLSQKVLALVTSFVSDTTVDRVKDISGDILKTTEERIKEEKG